SLGLSLRVDEGLTGQEEDGNLLDPRKRREREITGRIRGFKRVTAQVAGRSQWPDLGDASNGIRQTGPRLEPLEPAPFDEVVAEPAKPAAGLVAAKVRSGNRKKERVGLTGCFAFSRLTAEIDHPQE